MQTQNLTKNYTIGQQARYYNMTIKNKLIWLSMHETYSSEEASYMLQFSKQANSKNILLPPWF